MISVTINTGVLHLFLAFGGRRKRELRERRKESRRQVGGLNEDVQDAEDGRERGEVRL